MGCGASRGVAGEGESTFGAANPHPEQGGGWPMSADDGEAEAEVAQRELAAVSGRQRLEVPPESPAAETLRAVERVSATSETENISSCGSETVQFSDSSVHSASELDDEMEGFGGLDENQKTVVHWLDNLGMLEYWPHFFEHELCDMEAVLHVTASELREIGCKPGHIKKFMKRLMDLQTIVLTKNEAAVREWVYSLRPRRGADGSVPAPVRKLRAPSIRERGQHYVSLRTLRRQGRMSDELNAIHERHPSLDIIGMPSGLHQRRHMSVEVLGGRQLRSSIDEGPTQNRHASLSSLGSTNLSQSEVDELDESATNQVGEDRPPMVLQPASG